MSWDSGRFTARSYSPFSYPGEIVHPVPRVVEGSERARHTLMAEHHANVVNVHTNICKSSVIWLQVVTDAGIHEAAYNNKEGSWHGTLQPANKMWW